MPIYTPIVTLLAVALYFFMALRVARARATYGIRHPAITGNTDFERIFRVHQNTLEWMPTFMLPLWLCALYLSDIGAAAVGLVWVGGRIVYLIGYTRAPEKRLPGFFIQTSACIVLFIAAAVGVIRHLVG
ncbi:MAG: MAPEG family protein [Stellaceae bacterium]